MEVSKNTLDRCAKDGDRFEKLFKDKVLKIILSLVEGDL
jgi:hypothetical protein